jgi:signal transduction histidine kinase
VDPISLFAHDVRSPLAIVKAGLLQLLERPETHGPLSESQRGIVKLTLRSALFLEQLFGEFVANEQLAGGSAYQGCTTTLGEVLTAALSQAASRAGRLDAIDDTAEFEALRATLSSRDIHVGAESDLEAPLKLNKYAFVRVLMNLVGNALQHAAGSLFVVARQEDHVLSVEIADAGPGLPESARQVLLGAPEPPDESGAGRGLLSTRRLVSRLGGSIRIGTGLGGRGTAIVVEVPLG